MAVDFAFLRSRQGMCPPPHEERFGEAHESVRCPNTPRGRRERLLGAQTRWRERAEHVREQRELGLTNQKIKDGSLALLAHRAPTSGVRYLPIR
jgi:hypothetical protein